MYLLLLALLFILIYPFSLDHFFSPSHPDVLFMFAHSSPQHLISNVLSLLMIYLLAQKFQLNEKRLVFVFFISSFLSLFISLLFDLPVLGSSVGIYGMIGFLIPEFSFVAPAWFSYFVFFFAVLSQQVSGSQWGKLFHIFGLTFGLVLRYFRDYDRIAYIQRAIRNGRDEYSLLGTYYLPYSIKIEYKMKK